jgi:hypothetical protein
VVTHADATGRRSSWSPDGDTWKTATNVASEAGDAAALEDPAPLTLAAAAPHAVLDALLEGVLEALLGHGAIGADLAGAVDTDAIAREEHGWGVVAAVARTHPLALGVQLRGVTALHRVSLFAATKSRLVYARTKAPEGSRGPLTHPVVVEDISMNSTFAGGRSVPGVAKA